MVAIAAAAILIREAEAAAVAIAFWRTAAGSAVLFPFAARHRAALAGLSWREALLLTGSGLCLGLHFALWLGSLELTTVASSVTLATMSPLFVALAATVLLGEQTSRPAWTGIMITVVGAAVIGLADSSDPGETTNAVLGDLMALGGAGAIGRRPVDGPVGQHDGVGAAPAAFALMEGYEDGVLKPVIDVRTHAQQVK